MGLGITDAANSGTNKVEQDTNLDAFFAQLYKESLDATVTDGQLNSAAEFRAYYEAATNNVLDTVNVNGGEAGTFALAWDYLDERGGYYNDEVNTAQFFLTMEYTQYVLDGGAPITGVIAKYAPDGGDLGTTTDRVQTLHDNIMGNWHNPSLQDKMLPHGQGGSNSDPVSGLYGELVAEAEQRGLNEWFGRPYYSGSEGADRGPTEAFESQYFMV